MTGTICAVAGGKGGVGTTTTAINVAAAMEQFGHDTVVVDADLAMGDLGDLLGVDPSLSVQSVLADRGSLPDALVEAACGITAVASENSLDAYADADPARLTDLLETLGESFDLVLADTSARVSHETTVPLGVADETLLVTTPDQPAVTDATLTADLAARVGASVTGAVITYATEETDVYAIGDALDAPVLGTIPRELEATGEEPMLVHAIESTAALSYSRLANRLTDCFFEGRNAAALEGEFHEEWFDEDGEISLFREESGDANEGTTVQGETEADAVGDDGGKDNEDGDDDNAPYMSEMWMHDGY
jgi:septum site-determining protein MinD